MQGAPATVRFQRMCPSPDPALLPAGTEEVYRGGGLFVERHPESGPVPFDPRKPAPAPERSAGAEKA